MIGEKIAPLMGAPAGSVLVHENASIANSILISSLEFNDTKRNKIVVSNMDFPSDVYTVQAMLPQMEIVTVHTREDITLDTDQLLDAIDERTRLVSLAHVCSTAPTSFRSRTCRWQADTHPHAGPCAPEKRTARHRRTSP